MLIREIVRIIRFVTNLQCKFIQYSCGNYGGKIVIELANTINEFFIFIHLHCELTFIAKNKLNDAFQKRCNNVPTNFCKN